MKKKVLIAIVLITSLIFAACGKKANAEIVKKLNNSINNIEKKLAKIEEVNQEDFLSEELLSFKQVQETFYDNWLKMKDEEFVATKEIITTSLTDNKNTNTTNKANNLNKNNLKNSNNTNENTENNSLPNQTNHRSTDTYFENRLPRNVNTYFLPPHMPYGYNNGFGYGGAFGGGYGFGNMGGGYPVVPYQNNFVGNNYNNGLYNNNFNNQTNMGQNQQIYNKTSRRQPNVNTYGLGSVNINSYKNALKNESNNTSNTDFNNNAQVNLNKLTAIYSSASHLVNVSMDVVDIKERISLIISSLKESIKTLEKSDTPLSLQQVKSLEILIESINSNINKIQLSKNQLRYEIGKIKNIKDDFLTNNNELSARYILLSNLLDTRYSYYSNISNCLQEILYKIAYQFEELNNQNLNQQFDIEKINQNQDEEYNKNFEDNQEKVVIKDSDINVENITIKENTTLQNQLEDSWKQNYENNQVNNDLNNNTDIAIENDYNKKKAENDNQNNNQNTYPNNQTLINKNNDKTLINKNNDKTLIDKNNDKTLIDENNLLQENIDGFKSDITPKQEVSLENNKAKNLIDNANNTKPLNLQQLQTTFNNKNLILIKLDIEEIEKLSSHDFPFKNPNKNDYLSILINKCYG